MMDDIERCARCILPASLPSVELDEDGVCNHCRTYEASFGDWEAVAEQKKAQLEKLLAQAQQLRRSYDCLIPLSGGKDSTYALYLCKVYGLKCLCVTFDNGFLSGYARANIQRSLEATGADHLMYTANRDHLLRLYGLFLEKSGGICRACMTGINVSTQMATKAFDIPLLVHGGASA